MLEILGLQPLGLRLREARFALAGDRFTPKSRFDHTSLRILEPRLALALWRGRRPFGRRVPIYNLFNRTPTPEADGWSVRKTQVEDFRGGTLTYDSHNGTDFATPPGTTVVAPAAGRVVMVRSEFHRGGLKVMLDHGDGLITTAGHLGRALVEPGDTVARDQPIALSGASGLNFVGALLMDPPHVHFNVWLDGAPVDPFGRDHEVPLWRDGNEPAPHRGDPELAAPPSHFDEARVAALIDGCLDPALRAELTARAPLAERALHAIFAANYFPTRFTARRSPYAEAHPRAPRLTLPFAAADYDGVAW